MKRENLEKATKINQEIKRLEQEISISCEEVKSWRK